jgi:hypothetical protein
LIELLLGLQRPDKTSRTSSKPPSTDRKGKRAGSRPGGAKPGQKGHARAMAARHPSIQVDIWAMNDGGKRYAYPDEMVGTFEQDEPASYLDAA